MTSKFCRTAWIFAPLAFAAVTACSSDKVVAPPPGSVTISETEQNDVAENFKDPVILNALFGSDLEQSDSMILETISANVQSVGSLDINISSPQPISNQIPGIRNTMLPVRAAEQVDQRTFKAFAGQLVLDIKEASGTGTRKMTWMGIIAMNDLSNPTEIVVAGISYGPLLSIPSSISNTPFGKNEVEGAPEANAQYIKKVGTEYVLYEGTGGGMTISGSSYGSSKTCNASGFTSLAGLEGVVLTGCKLSHGSMQGSFSFTGVDRDMTQTINVSLTPFNLPSSRTMISATVDEENFD